VLVIRLPPRAAYSRPALALDLDQAAHEILRMMLRVIPSPRPSIAIIHAFDMPYHGFVYSSIPEHKAEAQKIELERKASRGLARLLATGLKRAGVPPEDVPRWRTQVRYGPPRSIIERAVKKEEADLLVLGTHGYSGIAYMLLGTVAGDVLREVACDVLVVPPVVKSRGAE
jgi:nucleotide-binding universal stress UspA family protein